MTSGYGLFMLGLVGLDVVLDPRRRKWVVPLLIPAVLYGAWYVTLGRSGIATYGNPFTPETLVALPRFIVDGMATAFGSAAGGGALMGRILIVALVAWIVYWPSIGGRSRDARSPACLPSPPSTPSWASSGRSSTSMRRSTRATGICPGFSP